MTNREEVIRALRLLFTERDVFEIRVLKAVTGGYQRPHTESGYFDFEHIPKAADALAKIRSFSGAYVTLNPVDPDLLARAFNRIGPAEQNATTADDDVSRRRWLPIDCDAVRKSNISSTDEEHAAALELADQIRKGLASLGWPQPIVLDSGNGAQLLYRIDLPAKDDGLVQNVIASIAAASTEQVHVDLTVFNPARIGRLPGTMNCKGDSIPNRPHRMAKIVSVPDKIETVSRALSDCGINCEVENADSGQEYVISLPFHRKRYGNRTVIVLDEEPPETGWLNQMQSALIKANRGMDALISGEKPTIDAVAGDLGVDRSFVAKNLQLANLAPDIAKMIWEGRQPKGLTLHKLREGIPDSWAEQRKVFGVG